MGKNKIRRSDRCHYNKDKLGKTMNIDTEILETIEKMPEYLKQELLHYAKYLMENYSKDISPEQHPVKNRPA
ncbi:MAG: DUF2281 domain-containing protein [Trichodesmium sp. St2_bin2_1]|nr:DUF2281 domain-containing protein [Trichodesmium sp. St2_bin2_1]